MFARVDSSGRIMRWELRFIHHIGELTFCAMSPMVTEHRKKGSTGPKISELMSCPLWALLVGNPSFLIPFATGPGNKSTSRTFGWQFRCSQFEDETIIQMPIVFSFVTFSGPRIDETKTLNLFPAARFAFYFIIQAVYLEFASRVLAVLGPCFHFLPSQNSFEQQFKPFSGFPGVRDNKKNGRAKA